VGDRDDRALVALQVPLQPRDGFGVQVVGRLVQEEDIGFLEQQPAERHPAFLAAGEYVHHLVRGRTAEGFHREVQAAVQIPAVGSLDLLLQGGLFGRQLIEIRVRVAEGLAHLVELGQEIHDLLYAFGNDLLYGLTGVR
jgi:hypothetical protein